MDKKKGVNISTEISGQELKELKQTTQQNKPYSCSTKLAFPPCIDNRENRKTLMVQGSDFSMLKGVRQMYKPYVTLSTIFPTDILGIFSSFKSFSDSHTEGSPHRAHTDDRSICFFNFTYNLLTHAIEFVRNQN